MDDEATRLHGGRLIARRLKAHGVTRFKFVCLIASEAGIARLSAEHPDVEIYAAECDPVLNDDAYIVPGLGDAGDRIVGTL